MAAVTIFMKMVSGLDKMQFESSNYYFVYGDTLFMMMDYQDQSSKEQIKAQQDWMKSVVKQNPTKWRVAVIHKSLFGYRMENPVASWTTAFDEAGVDMVFRTRNYVRTKHMQMVQTLNRRLTVMEQPISQAILEITTDADLIS